MDERVKTILVVEDDEPVAAFIQKSLIRMGYRVPDRANSGETAIALARRLRPDLVLMDIGLHGPMDGIRAAESIRDMLGLPVVFLTGYSDEDRVARARVTDAYGYILKPFHAQELKSAIELALHKHAVSAQLKERERFFSTTLRSIADAVMAAGVDGRITFMNPVAEVLTGVSAEDAQGRLLQDVYRTVDEETRLPMAGPWVTALQRTDVVGGTAGQRLLMGNHGVDIPVDDSASTTVDEQGNVMGVVLVFRDVTERRRLEKRLAISERLASLGTLAAGFAHEVNNPMAYVLANVEFCAKALTRLETETEGTLGQPIPGKWRARMDDVRTALTEAQEGAERVCRIVADVKAFSRPEPDSRKWLDVRDVVDGALKMMQSLYPVRASIDRDYGAVPMLLANESRLGQLFLNLMLNAAQAIPEGSPGPHEIRVVTRTHEDGKVLVEVHDTGVGITPEALRRVFDPFFTTKPAGVGTGLGLSICHRIVTDLGGDITVESQVGRGSVFRVLLPATVDTKSDAPRSPAP
jgi:PAS domain S-box-containing protein